MAEFIRSHTLLASVAFTLVVFIVATLLGYAYFFWRQIGRIDVAPPGSPTPQEPAATGTHAIRWLTRENWAEFERTVQNLITVIVVAHRVSSPDGRLYEAVRDNMQRGVRYKFLISNSTAQPQENVWYGIFELIAKGLEAEGLLNGNVEDAVEILKLPEEWDDYPYVFYLSGTRIGKIEKIDRTVAFRGTDQKKGICNSYKEVSPEEAHTLARVIMQGAPDHIVETMRPAVGSTFDTPLSGNPTGSVDVDLTRARPS
ncbi:MAG TPA: hypothetical protein VNG71_17275 [Pyrinomonadaceae bacterium]|nr:hypothetical protein [Pyrinomonadaceae bacterium]